VTKTAHYLTNVLGYTMASEEIIQMERNLEEAFARFKDENPDVAAAIEVLKIPYAEYLRALYGLSPETQSISGGDLIL
jgi:hypothetical protein